MSLRRPAKNQPESFEFDASSLEAAKNIVSKLTVLFISFSLTIYTYGSL